MESPGYLSLILTFICATIQLLILFDLIKNTRLNLPNKAIALAYAAIISFALYPFGVFIQSIYQISISSSSQPFNHRICAYRTFTQFTFTVGKILMYLFYTARLYEIFNGSTFKYKKYPLQIFGLFITVGFLTVAFLFGIVIIDGYAKTPDSEINSVRDCDEKNTNNSSFNYNYKIAAIAINMITDLVSSVIMLRLYLKKLILLSAAFDNFEFKSKSHRNKSEKFMKLILKTTNLLILAVISEYIILLVQALSIGVYWMTINHTINVLCIYFSFGTFNDKLYERLCCCVINKYCHRCCAALCFCCCLPKDTDGVISAAIKEHSKSATTTGNNDPDPSVATSTHNKITSHSTIDIELNVEATNVTDKC